MSENSACILCNNPTKLVKEEMEGYQKGSQFQIYHCEFCDTSFSHPHEVDESIYNSIYSQAQVTPGYNRYVMYSEEIRNQPDPLQYLSQKEGAYYAIKTILDDLPEEPVKILEIGSGLGYLSYAIHEKGLDITGVDISSDAVESSIKRFGDFYLCRDVYEYATNNATHYDIVILTEVIEHVPDPSSFCDQLINLLKENGKLIITTPNKSAFPSTDIWETELPPVHLSWLSETSFSIFARKKKLSVSFFDFTLFNKQQIDITKFFFYERFYKNKNKGPVLDEQGKVICAVPLKSKHNPAGKVKSFLKRTMKPLFIKFLTKKGNLRRNNILCVILEKHRK